VIHRMMATVVSLVTIAKVATVVTMATNPNNALANPLTFASLEHVEPDDLHA
jgi:hypothetical protein